MSKALLIIVICILLTNCHNERCGNGLCTDQFVSVAVDISRSDGSSTQLDSTKTYKADEVIFSETYSAETITYHTVVNDNHIKQLSFDGTALIFKGWLNGHEVISQEFVVGRDCCHIVKIEGPEMITLP